LLDDLPDRVGVFFQVQDNEFDTFFAQNVVEAARRLDPVAMCPDNTAIEILC
jgi:hypothetical protein